MRRLSIPLLLLTGLAAVMLVITLLPAEIWRAPANDAVYRGFDRNLVFATGDFQISRDAIDATAQANHDLTINLATTLRRRLAASVQATVSGEGAVPFRIGAWSPWTASGYFVDFGPAPAYAVDFVAITDGGPGPTLIGGHGISTAAGSYLPGSTYTITFFIDRDTETIRAAVSGSGVNATGLMTPSSSPDLFGNVQLSLTGSAAAGSGTARVALRNYVLTLPHERAWAVKVDDATARVLTITLAFLGIVAIGIGLTRFALRGRARPQIRRWVRISPLVLAGAAVYLAANAALFPLGGHPFDFANEQLYACVARTYGLSDLFFLPDVTSLASIWAGIPWVQATFPYQAVIAYLFDAIGWVTNILFGFAAMRVPSDALGYVIKSVNAGFGLADAVLIYLILRELKVNERWSRLGAAMFAFNPAVWFSMSVWGQTHVLSICLVLLAVLFTQRRMPMWSWLALIAACLTRPQMVVFGLLLGVVLIKKFMWQENVPALSWAIVLTFVALVPLTLATAPSLPVDVLLNNFRVQEVGGNQATLTTVSQDAYSVWPLVTYFVRGATSLQRAFTPSSEILFGSLTYQTASQILLVPAMLAITAAIALRKRSSIDSGGYLPLVAVGVTTFFMLLTGVVATHFLLALPMLLLCRRWMDSIAYCYVVAIWSISTLVPMFGDMAVAVSGHNSPLASENNVISQIFVNLYAWDRFITVAIVANICAVIWLAVLSRKPEGTLEISASTAS